MPQKSRTKRFEFIENSTELNRQKSCKDRIHSWSHAPLSLCTIYCSHQVRGWLVAVGAGERSILEVCSSSYSGTFCSRRPSYPLSSWIHAATPRGRPSPAPPPRARRGPASSAFLHGTYHVARVALLSPPPPRRVSQPQKKSTDLRFRRVGWRHTYTQTHRKIIYRLPAYSHLYPLTHTHTYTNRATHTHTPGAPVRRG